MELMPSLRTLRQIEDKSPIDTYWTLIKNERTTTLYFHTGGLRLRMARIDSKFADVPLKLLKDLQVPVMHIDDESGDRLYVLMKALPSTPTNKVWLLKDLLRYLDRVDIHYWAWKFGNENQNVVSSALRKLFRL